MTQNPPFPSSAADLSAQVQDHLEAFDFAERRLPERADLRRYYAQRRQLLCEAADGTQALQFDPALPPLIPGESALQKSQRYLLFLLREIAEHEKAERLTLSQVHTRAREAREQLAAIRRKLEVLGQVETAVKPAPVRQVVPQRTLLEVLVDPRSIQWFLAAGGGLFVIGLVVLLWALQVFQYPLFTAAFLGAGSLAIVLGGWAILTLTRYQLAGRALTLLGCLVLPLNLWYYHASGLLVDHLWVPALVGCVIYAASAWRLRDPMFVPVLVAGIALAGLLILADLDRFGEIAAPAALLVVLGLVCLHTERAFPDGDGPFTRGRFGLAFFWSGQAALGAGLVLLLGGQLIAPFYPVLDWIPGLEIPGVTTEPALRWLALGLVLAATYAYLYSDLLVRHHGVYTYLAAFTLIWAEVLLVDLLQLGVGLEVFIVTLALTGLTVNLLQGLVLRDPGMMRGLPFLGLLLNLLAVVLALFQHLRVTALDLRALWPETAVTWTSVAALVLAAISSRLGAHLQRQAITLAATYFFATAAATLMGAAELLVLLDVKTWAYQAPWLMLIPLAYSVAARLYRGNPAETPLVWCGQAATALMVVASLGAAFQPARAGSDWLLALFCAEAALFYALNAAWRQRAFNIYLATALGTGALWLVLVHFGVRQVEWYTLVFAGLGLVLLLAYRLALVERVQPKLAVAAFQCGNALLSLALLAGILQTLLPGPAVHNWPHVWYLLALAVFSLAGSLLVQETGWRRWYQVAAVLTAALTLFLVYRLLHLEPWRTLEIFGAALGILILVASHLGWARESEAHNEQVSFGLAFGGLLTTIPLAAAVLIYRFGYTVSVGDEIVFVTVALALFGSGFILRLRATTLIGAVAAAGYLIMLLVYMHRFLSQMWIMGIYLALGGLALFGVGLLLSVYRDHLLALPGKISRREGVFKVLNWR